MAERKETTISFKTDKSELEELDALLASIESRMQNIASGGVSGGSSTPGSSQPSTGMSIGKNIFGTGGAKDNPGAVGFTSGVSAPFNTTSVGSTFGGSGGYNVGAISIIAQTVNIIAQNVSLAGNMGGGGRGGSGGVGGGGGGAIPSATNNLPGDNGGNALPAPPLPQSHNQTPGSNPQSIRGTLAGLMGRAGGGLLVADIATQINNAALSGDVRWQQTMLNTFGSIPVLGSMINGMIGKPMNRWSQVNEIDETLRATGGGRRQIGGSYGVSDTSISLQLQMAQLGMVTPVGVQRSLDVNYPIGTLKESAAKTYAEMILDPGFLANPGKGTPPSIRDAWKMAIANGDWKTAQALSPGAGLKRLYRDKLGTTIDLDQLHGRKGRDDEAERNQIMDELKRVGAASENASRWLSPTLSGLSSLSGTYESYGKYSDSSTFLGKQSSAIDFQMPSFTRDYANELKNANRFRKNGDVAQAGKADIRAATIWAEIQKLNAQKAAIPFQQIDMNIAPMVNRGQALGTMSQSNLSFMEASGNYSARSVNTAYSDMSSGLDAQISAQQSKIGQLRAIGVSEDKIQIESAQLYALKKQKAGVVFQRSSALAQEGLRVGQAGITTGQTLAGYFNTTGSTSLSDIGGAYDKISGGASERLHALIVQYAMDKAGGAGKVKLAEEIAQITQARSQYQLVALDKSRALAEPELRMSGSEYKVGQSSLSMFAATGVSDSSSIATVMNQISKSLDRQLAVMQTQYDRDKPMLGGAARAEREQAITEKRNEAMTFAVQRMTQAVQMLSEPSSLRSSNAGIAAQRGSVFGLGSLDTLGASGTMVSEKRASAAIYRDAYRQAVAQGLNPAVTEKMKGAWQQAELEADTASFGRVTLEMPAAFRTGETLAQGKLQRQMSSWSEPGSVLDSRMAIMRQVKTKVDALDVQKRRLQASGNWTPAMENSYQTQREQLRMDEFSQKQAMDQGWIDRITARSQSAPSGSFRIKPSFGEAAGALDSMGMQSRSLGFVSDRGYMSEAARGYMTAGIGPQEMFPGDVGLQGYNQAISGGKSEEYLGEMLGVLKQIAGNGKSMHPQPGNQGGGPATNGNIGMASWIAEQSVGPRNGDTGTKGRR